MHVTLHTYRASKADRPDSSLESKRYGIAELVREDLSVSLML